MSQSQEWSRRRSEDAQALTRRLERIRAAETVRARELVRRFLDRAAESALATGPLLARNGDGSRTCRTPLVGWYLTRDGSIGLTTAGDYVNLVHPIGLRSRLSGLVVQPTDPPVQVGAGGRDGESVALDVLLAMRLSAGDDWPIHGR